tara:strand:- start:13060 stop:13956 length:897 start_codon:yes stop_codon:yes gene_type:complete
MSGVPTADQLFDAELLEQIAHLRVIARRVAPGGRFAEQRSRDRGTGIEFEDHRPYSAGDDLRTVDWHLYQRFGTLFLRLFEEQQDLPLYLLPDVSKSAFHEDPPRALASLRCALALAAVGLNQHDAVGVFPFSDDLKVQVRPQSGRNRVMHFAKRLAEVEPGGGTDFARCVKRFGSLGLREGLVIVISDFFDPGGIEAITSSLKKLRHRLLLVQLSRSTDREPDLLGDLRLEDCESGTVEDVSVTPQVLDRYRAAYDRWNDGLHQFTRSRGAGLLRVDVDQPVLPQLAALFEGGRYSA